MPLRCIEFSQAGKPLTPISSSGSFRKRDVKCRQERAAAEVRLEERWRFNGLQTSSSRMFDGVWRSSGLQLAQPQLLPKPQDQALALQH